MKRLISIVVALTITLCANAQGDNLVSGTSLPEDSVRSYLKETGLWKGWFVQLGGDWTVQKPYSYPVKGMIKNGSTLGVDAVVGKRFTDEMSMRAKVSWDNGIIDTKANWLTPFFQPGVNHQRGGFLSITGDIMLDLHNIIAGYKANRVWNTGLFLRAGGVYNFGGSKGSPLIGLGWSNQFRLTNRWGLYADIAYNGVSSGFTMDPTTATGVGTGSNMYFTLDLGATYRLGDIRRTKTDELTHNALRDKSFWRNWFLQFGPDMTLYNPCEKDFKEVFPKGVSMGVDLAVGKWFSPQIGARLCLNLENFLIENKQMEWLAYDSEKYTSNYDGGGCMMGYFDVMVSAKHWFLGYERGEKWDLYGIGRMGLGRNKSLDSLSPAVGAGVGGTYRLNKNWGLYAETTYVGITSEFFDGVSWSGATGTGFNAIWDFNLGVQLNIGNLGW